MTQLDLRAEFRRALELTSEKHRLDTLIALTRNRISDELKRQYKATGAVAKAKIRGLGEVRLDGADPEPKPAITDSAAYASWLAERYPTEVRATIDVPAAELENALAALTLAGVTVDTSTVEPRKAFADSHLKSLEIEENDEWTEDADRSVPRWTAIDTELGEVVDGIGGRLPAQTLKVILATGRKAELEEDAEREDVELHPVPTEDADGGEAAS